MNLNIGYRNPDMQMEYIKALSQRLCDFKTELEKCKTLLQQTSNQVGLTLQFAEGVSTLLPPQIKDIAEPMHTSEARGQGLDVLYHNYILMFVRFQI